MSHDTQPRDRHPHLTQSREVGIRAPLQLQNKKAG